jgi:hypothetical protein
MVDSVIQDLKEVRITTNNLSLEEVTVASEMTAIVADSEIMVASITLTAAAASDQEAVASVEAAVDLDPAAVEAVASVVVDSLKINNYSKK